MDHSISTSSYSLSVCDLNTKFNDRCHVDWSKSNLISLVTLGGIYILKPQLDISEGPFHIELIRNPNLRFKHHVELVPRFDKMIHSFTGSQYISLFVDPALQTNLDTLSIECYPRHYRLAKWSPIIDIYPRHCLLATITVDYQLLIFTRVHDIWVQMVDLSLEYDEIWTQQHLRAATRVVDYESIKRDLHSLSFCNFCWKESATAADKPLLLAATVTGDIVVWQVSYQKQNSTTHQNSDIKCEVKLILRTEIHYITSMHLFKNLLVASAQDGQVVLYDLTMNLVESENMFEQQVVQNNLNQTKTPKLIIIPPTATLWHKDHIEVSDFYLQPISQDTFRIVLAKSTNICWCIINYTKKANDQYATLAISDSFSAIDGLDPEVSLHQTPATCLRPAGDRKAVLIADDGSFFQLEFINDRQDTSPEFSAIKTGKVDLSRMIPRGLCTSPNGILATMISSISLVYEPSKILAPAKLILLPMNNDRRFFSDCLAKLLDESWLESEKVISPMDICDRIDFIRSIYPLLSPDQVVQLLSILRDNLVSMDQTRNDIQRTKLKIGAFLFMKLLKRGSPKMIDDHPDTLFYKEACDKIFLNDVQRNLEMIEESLARKHNSPSSQQVQSLANLFKWISMSGERIYLRDKYKAVYNFIKDKYDSNETCVICSAGIPFVSMDHGTCGNLHRFDRCARSLLVVNLTASSKLTCEHCDRCFMTNEIWPNNKNLWLCSFCQ